MEQAFLPLFVAKGNLKFTKGTELRKMDGGRSLTVSCLGISLCQLSNSSLCKCFTKPLLNFSSRNRYVHRKLIAKDALASFFVPAYL